ncbi:MAG: tetratricopeptide repeat protein [Proteobacteria bacterium]|nr:tetratricopeptide repeat protein [Pseudomonadota bacterium]
MVSGCGGFRESQANRTPSLRVADAALQSGAPELALRVADLILAKDPNNVQALTARGDALYALGQRGKAREAYKTALSADPNAIGAQVGLGRTLVSSDPAAAESMFLAALEHDPDNITALNNLGVVRDLQGRNAEAQTAYRHALDVSPASADVQINLGMSLAVAGRKDDAVLVLRSAAAMPGAAEGLRKELVAALNLAGDGAWATTALRDDRGYSLPPVGPGSSRVAVAATPRPSMQMAEAPLAPLTVAPVAMAPVYIAPSASGSMAIVPSAVAPPVMVARSDQTITAPPTQVAEETTASGPLVAALSAAVASAPSSVSSALLEPPRPVVTQTVSATAVREPLAAGPAAIIAPPDVTASVTSPARETHATVVAAPTEPVPVPPLRNDTAPEVTGATAGRSAASVNVAPPAHDGRDLAAPVLVQAPSTPPSRAATLAATADHSPVSVPVIVEMADPFEAPPAKAPRPVKQPAAAASRPLADVSKPATAQPIREQPQLVSRQMADATAAPRAPARAEGKAAPTPQTAVNAAPEAAAPTRPVLQLPSPVADVTAPPAFTAAVEPQARVADIGAKPAPVVALTVPKERAPAVSFKPATASTPGTVASVDAWQTAPFAPRATTDRLPSGFGLEVDAVAIAGPALPTTLSDDIARYAAGHPYTRVETPRSAMPTATRASATGNGTPYVQIGVYNSGEDAIVNWVALTQKAGALLIDRQPTVTLDTLNGRPAWLLRTVGFANQAEANRFCLQLKVAGQRCLTGSTP